MMQTGRLFIRFFVQVEGNLVNRFFFFFVVGRVKITAAICWTAVVDGERGEVGGNETVSAAETSRVDCQLREREREERWRGRKKERIECYRCTTRPSGAIRARTVASLSCVCCCCCFGPPLLCLFPRPGSVSIIPWCPSALTAAGVRARPRPVRKSISAAPHRINAFHSDGPEEENRLVLFLLLLLSRIAVSIVARIFCFISRFLHTQRGRMTRRPSLLAWWCRVLLVDVAIIAPAAEHRQNMEEHSKCTCSLALGPGSWSSVAIRFH